MAESFQLTAQVVLGAPSDAQINSMSQNIKRKLGTVLDVPVNIGVDRQSVNTLKTIGTQVSNLSTQVNALAQASKTSATGLSSQSKAASQASIVNKKLSGSTSTFFSKIFLLLKFTFYLRFFLYYFFFL